MLLHLEKKRDSFKTKMASENTATTFGSLMSKFVYVLCAPGFNAIQKDPEVERLIIDIHSCKGSLKDVDRLIENFLQHPQDRSS